MTTLEHKERVLKHQMEQAKKLDPRDDDNSKPAPFNMHNCAYCNSGQKPCRNGDPFRCEYLYARND